MSPLDVPIKAFFDTETFLATLLLAEPPYGDLARSLGRVQLAMSDQVFSEILEAVRRSTALRSAVPPLASVSLPEIFNSFDVEIARVPPSMTINICQDAGNNKFLAGAMYLECDYLVTEVADLLAFESNPKWDQFRRANGVRTKIVGPAAFLSVVGKAS